MALQCLAKTRMNANGRSELRNRNYRMKAHIGADADSGLVHTVIGTSGNVSHVVEGNNLLHGEETDAFGDAGYQGVHICPDARKDVTWHVAMRPGKRKELDKENNPHRRADKRGAEDQSQHPSQSGTHPFG